MGPEATEDEEEAKYLAKRKMLGNIKFIGELGKLQIVHDSILHRYVNYANMGCGLLLTKGQKMAKWLIILYLLECIIFLFQML